MTTSANQAHFSDARGRRAAARRHGVALLARGHGGRRRHALHRRGGPGVARRRARGRHLRAQRRPARRPAAARPGLAGHPSRRRRGIGARAPARRRGHRPARIAASSSRARGACTRTSAASSRRPRTRVASTRSPSARASGSTRPGSRVRGSAGMPSRARGRTARSSIEEADRDRRRDRAGSSAGRSPTASGAVRRIGWNDILVVTPYNAQVRCLRARLGPARADRHGRQVPGPGGADRVLLDGDLERRGSAAERRVPLLAQPPERRDLASPGAGGARREPAGCSRSAAARSSRCAWSMRSAGSWRRPLRA